jgi:hypothetical protein
MKRVITLAILAFGLSALGVAGAPKDDVTAASTALGKAANYTWRILQYFGTNSQYQTDGKTEKDGFTVASMNIMSNTFGFVRKGTNYVIQTPDNGWQTVAESRQTSRGSSGSGDRGPGMIVPTAATLELPAVEVTNLIASATDWKVEGDKITGALTEASAKWILGDRGRGSGWASAPRGTGGGGLQPSVSNAKGTVTFCVKEGLLTKYETHVTGSMDYGLGKQTGVDRTKTVTIKDIGTTEVMVPDDAKKKLP